MRADPTRSDETRVSRVPVRDAAWRRWLMPLALLAAAFVLQALASRKPQLVEQHYSRKLFIPISHALSLINGLFGFSIAELTIYVLVVASAGTVIYQAREVYLRRQRFVGLLPSNLLILLWISGSAMMLFLLIWGLNYQREPLGGKLGFAGRNASDEQLKMISETIVNEVNSNYGESHLGVTRQAGPGSARSVALRLSALIESAYQQEPLFGGGCRQGPGLWSAQAYLLFRTHEPPRPFRFLHAFHR